VFTGRAFGATGRRIASVAEVVFNTAMVGYQESLTDPSYTGQILVATFPLIGNYGVNREDVESRKVQVAGFVVRELARVHSNYRATGGLSSYLAAGNVLGLEGVDTRAITRRLRTTGAMAGVLTDRTDLTDEQLVQMARQARSMAGQNLVPLVGCSSKQTWNESLGDWAPEHQPPGAPLRVLALDCGAKANILRNLTERGCEVTVIPHTTPASEIRKRFQAGEVDGLFISNGPGDPAAVGALIATLRDVMADRQPIPTFGICLGHQLLGLALGLQTFKLPFGHRGANHPVKDVETGRIEITSQNHGFAVVGPDGARTIDVDEPVRWETDFGAAQLSRVNLYDRTVEGLTLLDVPAGTIQYHPEAGPGPNDAIHLFDEFVGGLSHA